MTISGEKSPKLLLVVGKSGTGFPSDKNLERGASVKSNESSIGNFNSCFTMLVIFLIKWFYITPRIHGYVKQLFNNRVNNDYIPKSRNEKLKAQAQLKLEQERIQEELRVRLLLETKEKKKEFKIKSDVLLNLILAT